MSTAVGGLRTSSVALVVPPSDVDYGARIATILADHHPRLTIDRYDPTTDSSLPRPGAYDHVIVTGSTAHVDDAEPWIEPLATHLRLLTDSGTPVLGVCFGHQLLAASLGGAVESLPERAAGYREIMATTHGHAHPLFRGLPTRFVSFLWHRDHVTSLPPDGVPLARNDTGIQAFACRNRPAAGIQFHPEIGLVDARALVATRPRTALPGDVSATTTDAASSRATRAQRIYANAVTGLRT